MTLYKYVAEVTLRTTYVIDVEAASIEEARKLVKKMSPGEVRKACDDRPDLPGPTTVHPSRVRLAAYFSK